MRLHQFLESRRIKEPISFHMPGHKGSRLFKQLGYTQFLTKVLDWDITELPGADNLFQSEGILKEGQKRYAQLYNVKKSYYLINGSSGGLIAAILATVPYGGSILMARNSHKSIFNALTLGNITPVYMEPELIDGYGISAEIKVDTIKDLLNKNPQVSSVILPSPNYYGVCSDVEAIAEEVHKQGKILIVDQAHGAHLYFFEKYLKNLNSRDSSQSYNSKYGKSAESSGADIVVNSTHKTLCSLTQSAILNVVTDNIDLTILEDNLQVIESSSPSYILMASLEINCEIIENHGLKLISNWHNNLEEFYKEAKDISGLKILSNIYRYDRTKINLDFSQLGISGNELEKLLMEHNIYTELNTGNIAMCMTGIGNNKEDYDLLIKALKDISKKKLLDINKNNQKDLLRENKENQEGLLKSNLIPQGLPIFRGIPRTKTNIKLDDGVGRVAAVAITPYPPGIPLLCPGEELTQHHIDYIKHLKGRGDKVLGVNEKGEIFVGE